MKPKIVFVLIVFDILPHYGLIIPEVPNIIINATGESNLRLTFGDLNSDQSLEIDNLDSILKRTA